MLESNQRVINDFAVRILKLAPGLGIEPRLTESKSVVLPLHNPGIIKQDRFNIVLPLHQTLRLRSRTVPFLFKRSVLLMFAVTILKLAPPTRIELA